MNNGSLVSYLRINPDADRIPLVGGSLLIYSIANNMLTQCMNICAGLSYIHAHKMVLEDLLKDLGHFLIEAVPQRSMVI